MRKDITVEKILLGGEKLNKSELARQYGCCWRTIDRRLNPEKYKRKSKERSYISKLDSFKNIIDEKIETARKMLDEKLDINLISKITGISKDEIEKLT